MHGLREEMQRFAKPARGMPRVGLRGGFRRNAALMCHDSTISCLPCRTCTSELIRYLDYCRELLSLLGKISALYIQEFRDPVALASASEFEGLTRGLSQKIWQKIIIAEKFEIPKDAPA